MKISTTLTTAAAFVGSVSAYPPTRKAKCPPFKGNFTIKQYQLYPENADFDFNTCKLYVGQLWNASLGIYDPYTDKHEIVEFEGISHNSAFHLGAVQADRKTGHLSLIADAANAFPSEGKDISGTNWLLKWDPKTKELIYKVNLTETSQGLYGGFQDIEQDPAGNVFVVGTWPGSLLKVSKDGKKVEPWYLPSEVVPTNKGIGGIAALGYLLLAQGDKDGILRFDLKATKGVPTPVRVTPAHTFGQSDAIYLPPKYNGTVLLVAEDTIGVSVFQSKDAKWEAAEYKGTVPIGQVDPGTAIVTPAQVGDAIYQVLEPFGDEGVNGPGTAGKRSDFLFRDITEEVAVLLK